MRVGVAQAVDESNGLKAVAAAHEECIALAGELDAWEGLERAVDVGGGAGGADDVERVEHGSGLLAGGLLAGEDGEPAELRGGVGLGERQLWSRKGNDVRRRTEKRRDMGAELTNAKADRERRSVNGQKSPVKCREGRWTAKRLRMTAGRGMRLLVGA